MFDFWKEVIINDAARLKKVTDAAGKTGLRVERCADYLADYVLGKKVYKTEGRVGTPAVIDLEKVANGHKDSIVRIELGLSAGQDSEFARPWFAFKKPVAVEFENLDGLCKALREALPAHIAVVRDNKLVLIDARVCVKLVEVADRAAAGSKEDWAEAKDITEEEGVVTKNALPFGTGEWILENLRFPTHVNTRVAAPNADDMPVAGAIYNQYAFEYCVPKRGVHGSGAVGEPLSSVTHHIFYVLNTLDVDAAFGLLCESGKVESVGYPVEGAESVAKVEAIAATETPEDGE
jgi:hypothetical protein